MRRAELIDQIPGLRRYARALTGDPWAADDLVQDTRVQRREGSGLPVDPDDVAAELVAPDAAQDLAMDLQRCLLRLPEEQRVVLLLVSLEDMSYEQVARITGSPIGTVMSRLSRARTRLQALMNAAAQSVPPDAYAPPHLRRLK
jgi:DNA-directed RNA polymerase specialized sigma24 family protein